MMQPRRGSEYALWIQHSLTSADVKFYDRTTKLYYQIEFNSRRLCLSAKRMQEKTATNLGLATVDKPQHLHGIRWQYLDI